LGSPQHSYTSAVTRLHLVVRLLLAGLCLGAVAVGVLAAASAIALAIDWDIPEGHELKGPTVVFDANGRKLARLSAQVEFRRRNLEQISPHLQHAVIATEDRRFYEHQGVDPLSVIRAVVSNVRSGGIRQGGSTLTQQYVKNVYVGREQSLYRKVREAVISLQLEKELSKDEILEEYLNQVYFGEGAYGAEAAARTYFGVSADELTISQSATLASVLSAPSALSPRANPRGARARRNVVLDEMVTAGFIKQTQRDRAAAQKIRLVDPPERVRRAPYFVEAVRAQLLATYGDEAVYNGGLKVTTTLDLGKQKVLGRQVRELLPDDRSLDAGVAVVDPPTGDVIATYAGRNFKRSQVDLAMGRGTDGRPSGSTFKVFALVTALEQGRTLYSSYPAPGQITIGDWSHSGNGGCGSPCSLINATAVSANTVYAQVANEVGADEFTGMARRMGVRQTFRNPSLPEVLGTSDVTPLDMASAMATLANDGVTCPARIITQVRGGATGETLPAPDPRQPSDAERDDIAAHLHDLGYRFGDEDLGRCYRAVAPSVARTATQALEAVVQRGTGRGADIDRPQAGKTGTAQDNQEAWFVGYTPDIAAAVAFFHRDSQKPLVGIPGCSSVCFGGDLPATIWARAVEALLRGVKPTPFPEPGEDERVFPERRRLQAPTGSGTVATPAPVERSEPPDEATETPAPREPTEGPSPSPSPTPSPSPSPDDDDDDDDGGILPLPPP
jgi:penicillin-binding protein 1A